MLHRSAKQQEPEKRRLVYVLLDRKLLISTLLFFNVEVMKNPAKKLSQRKKTDWKGPRKR